MQVSPSVLIYYYWDNPIAIAHGDGKFFLGSNETGNTRQIGSDILRQSLSPSRTMWGVMMPKTT